MYERARLEKEMKWILYHYFKTEAKGSVLQLNLKEKKKKQEAF